MVGEHGGRRESKRLVVQHKRADKSGLHPADPTGDGDVAPELTDQLTQGEHADWRRVPERPERHSKHG